MINAKEELEKWYKNGVRSRWESEVPFKELLGKTIVEIDGANEDSDVIVFLCGDGSKYMMHHEQDCCESVRVNDICGDINCLLNRPLTKAECVTNSDDPATDEWDDSWTWTFYHLATLKGYVTIRWYGTSNGYYSESVDFVKLDGPTETAQKPAYDPVAEAYKALNNVSFRDDVGKDELSIAIEEAIGFLGEALA